MKNFWKDKNVCVTGGTGFIGSHVVDALVKKGAIVTVIVSGRAISGKVRKNLSLSRKKIIIKEADLFSLQDVVGVCKNKDILLHFAALDGSLQFKSQHGAEIFRINSLLTLNVLEASRINNLDRVMIMSSIDVYANSQKKMLREVDTLESSIRSVQNGYVWSKRMSEIAASMYWNQYGLKSAIIRAGNVYGPRDYASSQKGRVIPTFIQRAMRNDPIEILGDGMQERSFLYIKDFVSGVLLATEKFAVSEPINIASAKTVNIRTLAEKIIALSNSESVISYRKSDIVFPKKRISLTKAKKLLHWQEKTPLSDGLSETIQSVEEGK